MMQPLMSNTHYLLHQFFLFLADGAVFWVTLDRFCPLQHRGILPAKLLCTLLCCKKRTELIVF